MKVSMVRNPEVKQRDATRAVVVAVSSDAIFNSEAEEVYGTTEPLRKGDAFSFIKAVQVVNERLLTMNSDETLLFDVILMSNDSEEKHSKIIGSAKHYGLDIGRFYFCKKEESIQSLESNNVKLFLSTDTIDVCKALQKGVSAALLYRHKDPDGETVDQLKVVFSGDVIGSSEETLDGLREQGFTENQLHGLRTAKDSVKEFAVLIGEMRRRFGLEGSPLCTSLLTTWSSRDVCAQALKTLRGWGLLVDQAFCLAGAPRSLILNVVRPHVLCLDGLCYMEGVGVMSL
ncbi:cytosolic 5'-nucleotidase 1A [Esox lucius]|uniref:cytosolic 5'-nucleotidase 1A n=1 Tax=Esox lucius TaxID=8010 RepID=UPI0005760B24|nr:cytosolic 5'-nucleotidase 1A [Esox lucius]